MIQYAGPHEAMIKVIGVGGGGSNAVNSMIEAGRGDSEYVDFICTNTDAQALQHALAPTKIQLGHQRTGGLGAGANPEIGRLAAEEDTERLREVLEGCNMLFIAAGMGGGTGTGAAPVIAKIAKEMDILTVAVVTRPFLIEGKHRLEHAERGIQELKECVDSIITIPNQRLVSIAGEKMTLKECFSVANKVLLDAVYGIIDLIHEPGLINVDFADIRTVMSQHGLPHALMGTGVAQGENRAMIAAQEAISSPLLSNVNLQGAKSLLINFTGDSSMTLNEVLSASQQIKRDMDAETDVIFGAVCQEEQTDFIKVTVIATGFDEMPQDQTESEMTRSAPRSPRGRLKGRTQGGGAQVAPQPGARAQGARLGGHAPQESVSFGQHHARAPLSSSSPALTPVQAPNAHARREAHQQGPRSAASPMSSSPLNSPARAPVSPLSPSHSSPTARAQAERPSLELPSSQLRTPARDIWSDQPPHSTREDSEPWSNPAPPARERGPRAQGRAGDLEHPSRSEGGYETPHAASHGAKSAPLSSRDEPYLVPSPPQQDPFAEPTPSQRAYSSARQASAPLSPPQRQAQRHASSQALEPAPLPRDPTSRGSFSQEGVGSHTSPSRDSWRSGDALERGESQQRSPSPSPRAPLPQHRSGERPQAEMSLSFSRAREQQRSVSQERSSSSHLSYSSDSSAHERHAEPSERSRRGSASDVALRRAAQAEHPSDELERSSYEPSELDTMFSDEFSLDEVTPSSTQRKRR